MKATNQSSLTLVDARGLLKRLFNEGDMSLSLRTVRRLQRTRALPFYKISGKTLFDPDECAQIIRKRYRVEAKR